MNDVSGPPSIEVAAIGSLRLDYHPSSAALVLGVPAAGSLAEVPAGLESDLGTLAALDDALQAARADREVAALTVALGPLGRLLPGVLQAARGLPLRVVPPIATRSADLQRLEDLAAASGAPVSVVVRAALDPLLSKARATLARLAGTGWDAVALDLVLPIATSLKRATESTAAHDALVSGVADLLALLQLLGLPGATARLATELSGSYWNQAVFSFSDEHGGVRGSATLHHLERDPTGAAPGGLVKLVLQRGTAEVACTRTPEGAVFAIRSGAGRVDRVVPLAAGHGFGPTEVAAWASRAPSAALPIARYGALWRAAEALTLQYAYGQTIALRRVERKRLAERLEASPGLDVGGRLAAVRESGSGFELVPGASLTALLGRPLERPLRVLLLRAPESNAFDARFPPLALARLAAVARAVGAEVTVADLALTTGAALDAAGPGAPLRATVLPIVRDALAGVDGRYDVVGVSVNDPTIWAIVGPLLVEAAKGARVTFVLGGRAAARIAPADFADAPPVYVVHGEGDVPFASLLHAIAGRRSPGGLPGVGAAASPDPLGSVCVQTDFASLPTPDFAGFDLEGYQSRTRALPGAFLPYLFLRGCSSTCTFCADDSSRDVRQRPVDRVVADLLELSTRHAVHDFYFLNNLINSDRRYLTALLDEMARASLRLTWVDCARVTNLDRDLLTSMRASGCRQLTFGVDAGCDRLLTLTRKGFTVAEAERTIRETRAAGIDVVVNLIVGLPHETAADFEETRAFVARVRPVVSDFLVMPYHYTPGSALFNDPLRYGLKRRGPTFDVVGGATHEEHTAALHERVATLFGDLGYTEFPKRLFQDLAEAPSGE